MKKSSLLLCSLTCLIILAAAQLVNSANVPWNGASGANLFWVTPGNWVTGGSPGLTDDALFNDVGTTNDNISPTSIVTANTTIHALRLGQTNGFHNLIINSGVTLTVTGTNHNGYGPLGVDPFAPSITNALSTMFAGPWPGPGGNTAVQLTNTISGPGKLVLNNTNNDLVVRYCNGQNVVHYAILDLSGLSTFNANLARIAVGYGQPGGTVRAMGRLFLARTNILTLSGTNYADNVQLIVGDNSGNNDGNSTFAFLHLGQTNRINVDRVLIGGQKTPGQVLFNTNGIFTSPTLFLRGSDGVNRVTALRIGDESDTGATGSPTTGTLNLLDGMADILADTIVLGKSQNGNNTALATGNLLMGGGTLNVNTLDMAAQANSGYGGTVTGNATFSNTTVTVNTLLRMGRSAGSAFPRVANLNVTGGSMTVNGSYQNEGTVNINVTNATLAMPAGSAITARNVQLDGATLSGAASIKATNALNIYNNGVVAGAPILDLGNGAVAATWDVQGVASGSLTVSNALRGKGTLNGNIIQAPGASFSPGGLSTAGTLTISGASGNLTLNQGGTLNFDLSSSGLAGNDQIFASGTLTLNGTNDVFLKSLAGSLDTVNAYTLITSASLVGNSNQFRVTGPLLSGRYTFKFDTTTVPNNVLLVVGGTGPANQTWVGDGLTNTWDAQGATNWNSGSPSQFFNLDNVTFNDTGSDSPAVNVAGSLVPGTMTVSNAVKNYAFKGSGSLAVAGPLNKQGTGSLTFSNANDNTFSSLVTISNGTVTFANNGQNTFSSGLSLYGGAVTLSGNSTNVFEDPNTGFPVIVIGAGTTFSVLNSAANNFNSVQIQLDGSLIFNQPIDSTFNASVINAGLLQKSGAAKLTISGNNASFTGPVLINGGTVIAGSGNSALGVASVVVTNNAALDINGKNLGAVPITISGAGPTGAGALVNNGGPQNTSLITPATALHNVTLGTNATIGGSGHWNTDPILNLGYFVIADSLLTGAPHALTKVGQNQVSIMNASVDNALGDIDIKDGMLNFHGATTSMGDPSSNIIVRAGATLSFYDTSTPWDKKFMLFGDGVNPTIFNYNGTHTIAGSINLNGNCLFSGAPVGRGLPVSLTCNGPITGSGALVKPDPQGTLILSGANDYAGTTTVSGGSLFVDGVSATNTLTVSAGTLGGTGLIRSRVFIQSGAVLSPGDGNIPLSNLSISNSLSLAGTNVMDVFKSGSLITADLVTNITTLTLGGRLQVNLTGDPLTAGDSIELYSFSSASGAIAGITPSSPGFGLLWDTSHLTTDGTLRVSSLNITPTNLTAVVVGNQLNLSWPADHLGWRLQAQTNSLGIGLSSNWADVPGSDSVTNLSLTIDPANGAVFIRMIYP